MMREEESDRRKSLRKKKETHCEKKGVGVAVSFDGTEAREDDRSR